MFVNVEVTHLTIETIENCFAKFGLSKVMIETDDDAAKKNIFKRITNEISSDIQTEEYIKFNAETFSSSPFIKSH